MSLLSFAVFTTNLHAKEIELTAPSEKYELNYQIYASGFKVLYADLTIEYNGDTHYNTGLNAHTRGWLGKVVPWSGNYKTTGWVIGNNKLQPESHISSSMWRKSEAKKNFSYKKDGSFEKLYLEEKGKDYTPAEFDYSITDNSIDLLTATLSMMSNLPSNKTCNNENLVFDGKRSFNLKFKDISVVELKSNKYNSYSGSANKCSVEVDPHKGHWREKPRGWMSIQEQGRNKGALPTIWMGQIEGIKISVPVKIMVKTDYGTLMMHLKRHKIVTE